MTHAGCEKLRRLERSLQSTPENPAGILRPYYQSRERAFQFYKPRSTNVKSALRKIQDPEIRHLRLPFVIVRTGSKAGPDGKAQGLKVRRVRVGKKYVEVVTEKRTERHLRRPAVRYLADGEGRNWRSALRDIRAAARGLDEPRVGLRIGPHLTRELISLDLIEEQLLEWESDEDGSMGRMIGSELFGGFAVVGR